MSEGRPGARTNVTIAAFADGAVESRSDKLATEEPLELRLQALGEKRTIAVTMRTPGNDFELAAGFLASEGLIAGKSDLDGIRYCVDRDIDEEQRYNIVTVDLRGLPELPVLERHFMTSSACGVCGSAVIQDLADRGVAPVAADDVRLSPDDLFSLAQRSRESQEVFADTGGLHAAGLFSSAGELIALREDVGRHNAVDKVIGWAVLEERLPLAGCTLVVSGRAGFEIVQKAIVARIPVVAAVSAPSSLAVELARAFGITLVGFLRPGRLNVYSHPRRIEGAISEI